MTLTPSPLLRNALKLDAAASLAMGLVCVGGAGSLAGLLGLPGPFMLTAGITCLIWAAVTGSAATRQSLSTPVIWAIIAINAVWALESIALLALGWLQPSMPGVPFIIAQAAVVAVLAEAQFMGLKRSGAAARA